MIWHDLCKHISYPTAKVGLEKEKQFVEIKTVYHRSIGVSFWPLLCALKNPLPATKAKPARLTADLELDKLNM